MFAAPRNDTAFASHSKKKDVTFKRQNSLLITGLLIPIMKQQTVLENKKLLSPAVSVCFTGDTSFYFDEMTWWNTKHCTLYTIHWTLYKLQLKSNGTLDEQMISIHTPTISCIHACMHTLQINASTVISCTIECSFISAKTNLANLQTLLGGGSERCPHM